MDENTIQLYIELDGIRPKIWRRFVVGDMISFERLHRAIQAVMGWENAHLYSFQIDKSITIQSPMDDDLGFSSNKPKSAANHLLYEFLTKKGQKFRYIYDFGDDWGHLLKVEAITPLPSKHTPPFCIEGERACPPEDCGGVPGYLEILDTLKKPESPEYEDLMDWLDVESYEPEIFSPDKVNKTLVRMRSKP